MKGTMTNTETTEATSLSTKLLALRESLTDRVEGVADSGKALIATRRDDRRREELLRELGELHVAAANDGGLDESLAGRLVAEINAIGTDAPEAEVDDVEN